MRHCVSKGFRNLLEITYPWLNKKPAYWAIFRAILFGMDDDLTGDRVLDRQALAKAEGKLNLVSKRNYIGERFLREIQEFMTPECFSWSDWSYTEGKARVVWVTLTPEVEKAYKKERLDRDEMDLVNMETGKAWTTKVAKGIRESVYSDAINAISTADPIVQPLLEYMNNLPVGLFSKAIANYMPEAVVACTKIKDPLKKRVQTEILFTIQEEWQPFYEPSKNGKTVRIFPNRRNMLMLRSSLRDILCVDWTKMDLKSAQLAICARIWGVSEVTDFLKQGKSIWDELFSWLGLDGSLKQTNKEYYEELKAPIKDAVYAITFGSSKQNATDYLNKNLSSVLEMDVSECCYGERFMEHPLIEAMRKKRDTKMNEIRSVGYAHTAFGKKLTVKGSGKKTNIPNILAEIAQSYELALLLPVLDLAKSTNDFYITLWLHDGFTVHFTDSSKKQRWSDRICKCVDDKAKELNVFTYLEVH